eukprot:TRINITY_DN2596_c0_g5_i1.p1 TRINITY_DN2596_c0_g5~~TRINITY_DN2596_c0_g5_i1.p1  ORF type:complete len:131 (-),score=41.20 TRINITY_DN2596_c0_g5_i1:15-407(-)
MKNEIFFQEQFSWMAQKNFPEAFRILDTQDLHFLRNCRKQAIQNGSLSLSLSLLSLSSSSLLFFALLLFLSLPLCPPHSPTSISSPFSLPLLLLLPSPFLLPLLSLFPSPVLCVDTVSYTHLTLPTICSV